MHCKKKYTISFQQIELGKHCYDEPRIYLDERYNILHFIQMGTSPTASVYNATT